MVDLFDRRFFSTGDDVLSEYFSEQWVSANDARAFEPGHHFEWVWLLDRYAAATGFEAHDRMDRLLRTGLHGIDAQSRVIDEMGRDGPMATSCRLWPAMEGAKALCVPLGRVARPSGMADALNAAWLAFFAPAAPGGWIDRIDPLGAPQVDHMPASSLYHICTALDYVTRNS
jgi:mannose/cellobiose epimerase-like protein (N-acyl-D-glucosamine 2-epimerase family)